MIGLTDETLAQIGRVTVEATTLEYVLAVFATDRLGGDPEKLMMITGGPLREAKKAAEDVKDDPLFAGLASGWRTAERR